MNIEWATLIEGGIPVVGGLYAAALGFGLIRPAGLPLLHRPGLLTQLNWLEPAVAVFGIYTGWQSHSHIIRPDATEIARTVAK